jgi:NADPH-dependent ferric siderophore reductase
VAVEAITARTRRIRVAAAELGNLSLEAGADLLFDLGGPSRHYSVWRHDRAGGAVELAVVAHAAGIGGEYWRTAVLGQQVRFTVSRPLAIRAVQDAQGHHFFGDETSIATTEALVRSLASGPLVSACFEVSGQEDRWPAVHLERPHATGFVPRDGVRPGQSSAFIDHLSAISSTEQAVYATGETRLVQTVMDHFKRRGWPPSRLFVLPYWRLRPSYR